MKFITVYFIFSKINNLYFFLLFVYGFVVVLYSFFCYFILILNIMSYDKSVKRHCKYCSSNYWLVDVLNINCLY